MGGSSKGKSSRSPASGESPGRSPETSVEMPGVTDRSFTGTVKSFNENKGFGFIACDEIMEQFGGDVFLHHQQFRGLEVGQEVTFEVFLNKDQKPQAKGVAAAGGGKRSADAAWSTPAKKWQRFT